MKSSRLLQWPLSVLFLVAIDTAYSEKLSDSQEGESQSVHGSGDVSPSLTQNLELPLSSLETVETTPTSFKVIGENRQGQHHEQQEQHPEHRHLELQPKSQPDLLLHHHQQEQQLSRQGAQSPQQAQSPVSRQCLGCLCEAASGCNSSIGCRDALCGPFRISRAYYVDSEIAAESAYSHHTFESCTQDLYCAAAVVSKYMLKYGPSVQDCNGDGRLSCLDFALIHRQGPRACLLNHNVQLTRYYHRYVSCAAFAHLH